MRCCSLPEAHPIRLAAGVALASHPWMRGVIGQDGYGYSEHNLNRFFAQMGYFMDEWLKKHDEEMRAKWEAGL